MKSSYLLLSAASVAGLVPLMASAQVVYSDGFNTDTSANYNLYVTAGATGPSGDATFAYNYGAAPASGGLAIPVAPHTTDGSTLGLRLRTDNLQTSAAAAVVGATSIATKALVLPSYYTVSVDVWSDYIGGASSIAASGSNGTTGVAVGVNTAGTSQQYIAANDGALFEAFGDNGGGTNNDYRIYNNGNHATPTSSTYYAAGTGANSATNTDPYYTGTFPSVAAPAAQSSYAASQGGSTAAGTQGFAWHTWTITEDGTNVTWAIDGKTIGTLPQSAFTAGGSQVTLGNDDTGLSGNSAANNQLFNAEIFDNFTITVPEPTTLAALGIAGLGTLARRRRA